MIRALHHDDVPAAAALLVARHAEHRAATPLLAPLDQVGAEREVLALLAADGAAGAVAVEGGAVVGYLIGAPKPGAAWGPNAWVEPAGCGGRHLPELYAALAGSWVAAGRVAHYVLVPPALAPVWFELGFGLQQVHAARVPEPVAPDPRVRRAVRADVPVLARLDTVLDEHLAGPPVFSAAVPAAYEAALADWEESFDDPAYTVFVAEADGAVVGSAVACDVSQSSTNRGMVVPARAALLGFAAVLPSARGQGLGRALGEAAGDWAAGQGYPSVCTDWRSTNLTAARTWPRLGYAQTFLRLHRLVGH